MTWLFLLMDTGDIGRLGYPEAGYARIRRLEWWFRGRGKGG